MTAVPGLFQLSFPPLEGMPIQHPMVRPRGAEVQPANSSMADEGGSLRRRREKACYGWRSARAAVGVRLRVERA